MTQFKNIIIEIKDGRNIDWIKDNGAIISLKELPMEPQYEFEVCCPDFELAQEKGYMKVVGKTSYIKLDTDLWDMDFCPFCGNSIIVRREK